MVYFQTLRIRAPRFMAALLACGIIGLISTSAIAADESSKDIANSLPAQIPEIMTGGKWSNGDVGGHYRAIVVLSKPIAAKVDLTQKASFTRSESTAEEPERKAEVFVQWISHADGKAVSKVVKTVSIKEFNEKQLRHAFLAMDTLTDNEMTLLVTSYDDRADKDVSISIKATTPGKYTKTKDAK